MKPSFHSPSPLVSSLLCNYEDEFTLQHLSPRKNTNLDISSPA